MKKKTKHKFHGYAFPPQGEREEMIALHIGYLRNRKGLCLYVAEQNKFVARMIPLAYFKNEEAGKVCQRVLDRMILKLPDNPTP